MPKRKIKKPLDPKDAGHYLLAWRNATKDPDDPAKTLTQPRVEELLKELGYRLSYSMVGRIEKGQQPYNQRVLEGLARVYGVNPAILLSHAPGQPDQLDQILRLWSKMPEQLRTRALNAMEIFTDIGGPPDDEGPQRGKRKRERAPVN